MQKVKFFLTRVSAFYEFFRFVIDAVRSLPFGLEALSFELIVNSYILVFVEYFVSRRGYDRLCRD